MISINLEEAILDLGMNFKDTLKIKLDSLLDKAPSDASLVSKIMKLQKGYEGAIEIISSQKRFLANAMHMDANELVHDLVNQINKQILKWRNERFLLIQ